MSRLYIVTLLIYLLCRVHHEKRWAGRSTSWNQDFWEKYHNLRYADDTTLMAESEEELKSLLMKVEVESEKEMGKQWKQCQTFYFLGLQNHCRW